MSLPPTSPAILLTGFNAFAGMNDNPSAALVLAMDGQMYAGHRVQGLVLPTVFGVALQALRQRLRENPPQLVLCCGLAQERARLSLERVALNLIDARLPDNLGQQPVDHLVEPSGPLAYATRLPVRAMSQAMCAAGIPAELSLSAGSFVCNELFYGLLHSLEHEPALQHTLGGFIHLPGQPPLSLAQLQQALGICIDAALQETQAQQA